MCRLIHNFRSIAKICYKMLYFCKMPLKLLQIVLLVIMWTYHIHLRYQSRQILNTCFEMLLEQFWQLGEPLPMNTIVMKYRAKYVHVLFVQDIVHGVRSVCRMAYLVFVEQIPNYCSLDSATCICMTKITQIILFYET